MGGVLGAGQAVAAAHAVFEEEAVGDARARAPFERKVMAELTARFEQASERKHREAEVAVRSLLEVAGREMARMADDAPDAPVAAIVAELEKVIRVVTDSPAGGPRRLTALVQFVQHTVSPLLVHVELRHTCAHAPHTHPHSLRPIRARHGTRRVGVVLLDVHVGAVRRGCC